MGAFDAVKWLAILGITTGIGYGFYYISNLQSDLTTERYNVRDLKQAVEKQKQLIIQKDAEAVEIKALNRDLATTIEEQKKDIDDLNEKFVTSANGDSRDFGKLTLSKPGLVNTIVNNASAKVNRCFEIATGAPLQEGETNAECKTLIDSLNR